MCSDTERTADTRCSYPGCQRKVWQDPDGSYSSYCGNSHRLAMAKINKNVDPQKTGGTSGASSGKENGSPTLCRVRSSRARLVLTISHTYPSQNCGARPVYIQNGFAHPFCGQRCAAAFRRGPQAVQPECQGENEELAEYTSSSGTVVASPPPSLDALCVLGGCKKKAYVENGVPTRFCSQRHRRESVSNGQLEACLLCATNPKEIVNGKQSDFCSRKCSENAINAAPVIFQLNPNETLFKDVEKQFADQWKHPSSPGNVMKIWRIISTREAYDKFSRYQLSVERSQNMTGGNSRRRWHGTVRNCRLGDDDNENTLCDLMVDREQCSLCGIIKSSFEVARSGKRFNFGRFGAGIYTTGTSSKANDYIVERGGSPYRAVLLNDVVLGKTMKLTVGDSTLTQPPVGFNSVIGEPGGDLNYDEAIVYNNEAIRPMFLVVFSR